MGKITASIEHFNAWMDASLDNRCCIALASFALGFWLHIARINCADLMFR